MKRILYLKTIFIFITLITFSLSGISQGHETFDNLNASGSTYTTTEDSYIGDNEIVWHHRGSRTISAGTDYEINGITCGFGSSTNDGYPGYVKATVTGGVGELSFNWRSYFTGGSETDRSIKVFINNEEVQEFLLPAMGMVYNENLVINKPGNVIIELRTSGTRQIAIDDIVWTGYVTVDPLLMAMPMSLSGFSYQEESGPSASQFYNLSGLNLDPAIGNITVSAALNFEVSLDNTTFTDFVDVSYVDGEFYDIPIYVRLKENLTANDYSEVITNSGGTAEIINVDVSGSVTPLPPELTLDGYTQNFATLISAETFPTGWDPDDIYTYGGDFGSGTSGGLRGNGVVGFQLTASAPTNEFKVTLTLINNTGQTIENLDVEYLGKVAREVEGTPKWIVYVEGIEIPELEYSTLSGLDELKTHTIAGLNIPQGANLTIEWFTTSAETTGTRRQIGITDVNINVPAEPQVETPVFNPIAGTYFEPFLLEITSATENADIFYKFNETDDWTLYTEALNITNSMNVWAQATKAEMLDSEIAFAEYIIPEGNIIAVETLGNIEVVTGTAFEELPLPAYVNVTLDDIDNTVVEMEVNWLQGDYNAEVANTYLLTGEIILLGAITNTDNLTAEVTVIVSDDVVEYEIVSVETIEDINVEFGTTFNDIPLPETVTVTLDNNATEILAVEWLQGVYDGNTAGLYTLTGNLQLVDGILNTAGHTAEVNVIVLEVPEPVEEVIAGWTFPESGIFGADLGLAENIGNEISREPAFEGNYNFYGGVTTQAISTSSWSDGEGTKYWVVEFSTLSYRELILSSAQQSSSTGPADFKVQYKYESNDWMDLANSSITVENNFTSGVLTEIQLPDILNNKYSVSLRWIMASNTAVGGDAVAGAGTNRIDDILIKGYFDDEYVRIIASVDEPQSISAEQGTPFNELSLPDNVTVHFEDLGSAVVGVNWLEATYDPALLGEQIIEGELILDNNMDNPNDVKAQIRVNVLEEILNIIGVTAMDPVTAYTQIPFENLNLPIQAEVILDDASTIMLDVGWIEGVYNPEELGTYTIFGNLILQTGILNPDNIQAVIEVVIIEPDLVAGWTFVDETQEANLGVEINLGNLISREPEFAGSYTYHTGVTDNAIGTVSWTDGQDVKYWIVEFSTLGYKDLVISSAQFSTPAGPRDFKVQYRIETGSWIDVDNADITVGYNFTQGVLNRIELPDIAQNKLSVSLRWIMTSNVSQSGGEVTSGRSQIDNVLVEGTFSDDFKRIVTGVEELEDIEVEVFTTVFEDLPLPETVLVFFDDGGEENLPVIWHEGDFDGDVLGTYTLEGDIIIDDNMENTDNIKATINIIVREPIVFYEAVFNVDMSTHPTFNPDNDLVYIRGDMNDWGVPGTDDPNQLMSPTGNPMIWTITFELEEGTYAYKYYRNAGTGNPEGGDDRSIVISDDIVIDDDWSTTSIYEITNEDIAIYPNPAENFINISSNYDVLNIQIINAKGQIMLDYNDNTNTVYLKDFNSGLYFVKITTRYGLIIKKIIINK